MAQKTAEQKAESKKTVIQLIKNFTMGFVVTIFESLSINPLINLFEGSRIADKIGVIPVANTVSVVVFFFVRFFVNYFWVFHSKKNVLKIIPLFAVLIAVFTVSTTELIELSVRLMCSSEAVFNALGEDNIITVSKFFVTFVIGFVNFAVCKWLIFNEKKPEGETAQNKE